MISVIIPTCNRSSLLESTLKSLTKQTLSLDKFEILVIDNGSTDGTIDVVKKFSCILLNLKYVYEKEPGLHAGRHCGLREALGSILTFADDDIEAFPTWLEGVYESFADPRVALVGGGNLPNYETEPPLWINCLWESVAEGKYMPYYSLSDFGDEIKEINPLYVFGCNFSIRKRVLSDIEGFHPDGLPRSLLKYRGDGETYVAKKVQELGFKTIYNPKASVKHWVSTSRMNLDYVKDRAFSEGITHSYIDARKEILEGNTKSIFKSIINTIKDIIYFLRVNKIKKEILKSFKNGYRYHQLELKKNSELVSWVSKKNYL